MKIIPIGKYAFSPYATYAKNETQMRQQPDGYERDDEKVAQAKEAMRDGYCFETVTTMPEAVYDADGNEVVQEPVTERIRVHTNEEYDAYFAQYLEEHTEEFYKLENGQPVIKYVTVQESVAVEYDLPTAIEVEDVDALADELSRYAKKFVCGKLVAGVLDDALCASNNAPMAIEAWYEKYYQWIQMLARGGVSVIIDNLRGKTYTTLDELVAEAEAVTGS